MTYTFARIKPHPATETDWYLVIQDHELLMEMHRSATTSMFLKFDQNPHIADSVLGGIHNPIKLGAGWLQTACKGLSRYGRIYMNRAHGLSFGSNVEVHETRQSDRLEFPSSDPREGVQITITSWRDGQHYYLSSNTNQVFSKHKYDTADEAIEEAKRHAFDENISFKPGYRTWVEGD